MQTNETTLLSIRPSRVIVLRYYVGMFVLIFLIASLWFFNALIPPLPITKTTLLIGGTALLGFLTLLLFVMAEYKRMSTRYIVTDFRVIRKDGILRRVETVVPYRLLERVQLTQGVLDSILGIGTLIIDTGDDTVQIASVRNPESVEKAILSRMQVLQQQAR